MASVDRTQVPASDDEIEAAFSAYGYGLTVEELSFGPVEEMDHFKAARAKWAEPGQIFESTDTAFIVERVQPFKGSRRRDVVVLRFGDFVAIDGMDQ